MKVTMTTAVGDLVVDDISADELPAIIELVSTLQPSGAAPPTADEHINGTAITTNGHHTNGHHGHAHTQEPPLWPEEQPRNGASVWTPPPPPPGILATTLAALRELDRPEGVHITILATAMEITEGAASGRLGDLLTGGHVYRLARGHYRAITKES